MQYKYITEDNLENKQDYMYSEFCGKDFLNAYKRSRLSYISETNNENIVHNTRSELESIRESLKKRENINVRQLLDQYVKRFEVSKRLFTEYNESWKPTDQASYEQFDLYILLSECCIKFYTLSNCAKYFSCALKIDDTLLSIANRMTVSECVGLREILRCELAEYDTLALKVEIEG